MSFEGLSSLWTVRRWRCRRSLLTNLAKHMVQLKGFSLVWERSWRDLCSDLEKDLAQKEQM